MLWKIIEKCRYLNGNNRTVQKRKDTNYKLHKGLETVQKMIENDRKQYKNIAIRNTVFEKQSKG